MKALAMTFLSACLWAAAAAAQTSQPAESSKNTTLQVELNTTLDSKKAKPGDQVTATLTQDVLEKGQVILPRGSKVIGHVKEAKAHTKENPESRVALVFEKILPKRGEEIACACTVAAVAPPITQEQSSNRNDDTSVPQSMGSKGNLSGGTLGGVAGNSGRGSNRNSKRSDGASGSISDESIGTAANSPNGALSSGNRGVIGIEGMSLASSSVSGVTLSILISEKKNVKLESGTQLVLLISEQGKK